MTALDTFWSDLSAGSWTELVAGVGSILVAGALGGLALAQGRRANRLAEAILDVRFEAAYVPMPAGGGFLVLRCSGPTVWLRSVEDNGSFNFTVSPDGEPQFTPLGDGGPLQVLGVEGAPPWHFQRDGQRIVRCDWVVDVSDYIIGTLNVSYSTTRDGEVHRYDVDAQVRRDVWPSEDESGVGATSS